MPEALKKSEVTSHTDPSQSKQLDTTTPLPEQWSDLYKIIDGQKISMLTTMRPDLGPVSRSMAIASRSGPDILYLSNADSTKFSDLSHSPTVLVTIQDTNQNWVSITGTATNTSNDDPRIKDLYFKPLAAWFGDLGDGVHDGTATDPRIAIIEVKPKYIVYWKKEVTSLGFAVEIARSVIQGDVAQAGVIRELREGDIEQERKQATK